MDICKRHSFIRLLLGVLNFHIGKLYEFIDDDLGGRNTGCFVQYFYTARGLLWLLLCMSMQSSMKGSMMSSNEASGVDQERSEENISVSDCRAACVCPTETRPSACFRTASVFEDGAILYSCDEVFFFSFGCCVDRMRRKSAHFEMEIDHHSTIYCIQHWTERQHTNAFLFHVALSSTAKNVCQGFGASGMRFSNPQ
jgi:hypothetical protein